VVAVSITKKGEGFGRRNLFNMVRFAEVFPDFKIVQATAYSRKL